MHNTNVKSIEELSEELMSKGIARTKLDAEQLALNIIQSQNHTNVERITEHKQSGKSGLDLLNEQNEIARNKYHSQKNAHQQSHSVEQVRFVEQQTTQFDPQNYRLTELENTITILRAELREAKRELEQQTGIIENLTTQMEKLHELHEHTNSRIDTIHSHTNTQTPNQVPNAQPINDLFSVDVSEHNSQNSSTPQHVQLLENPLDTMMQQPLNMKEELDEEEIQFASEIQSEITHAAHPESLNQSTDKSEKAKINFTEEYDLQNMFER